MALVTAVLGTVLALARPRQTIFGTAGHWLTQFVSIIYAASSISIYWTTAVFWASEASSAVAERSSANRPSRFVRESHWRRRRRPRKDAFPSISHHNRGSKLCLLAGVVVVVYKAKIKKTTAKGHATCVSIMERSSYYWCCSRKCI